MTQTAQPMTVHEAIQQRRSVRNYSTSPHF